MRYYVGNQAEIDVSGATLEEALKDAVGRYPALNFHIFDAQGRLRRHMNVFINDQNVRELKGLKTRLREEDRITLLASISGG